MCEIYKQMNDQLTTFSKNIVDLINKKQFKANFELFKILVESKKFHCKHYNKL